MGGNGKVLCRGEGAFLDDLFPETEVHPDGPFGCGEKVKHQIELLTFEPQALHFGEDVAQMVGIDSQPQVLPQFFDFTVDEALESVND